MRRAPEAAPVSATLRRRVLSLVDTGEAFLAQCPACREVLARFADLGGATVTASCPAGCTGRAILAAIGVSLAELERHGARRAA